jgi:DNA-binding CsgD family transcriptional regulator
MKEKILELRKNGLTINEIVKELNCAKSTVSYHINNAGLGGKRDVFISDVDDKTIENIKFLRYNNKTYSEIKKLLNISEDKLIKICRLHNINKSSSVFTKKEVNKEEIVNYYKTVKSLRVTAKFFKISRETIRQYIPDELIKENICNKKLNKISNSNSVINWRKRKKIELVNYKGGCCERCGYSKSVEALQFHHINPNEKDFTIGGKSYSIERLKKEVDKCIMVCANCHIEIHEELRK